jgi:glycosyltransferase involved in cell wall biosynthesis
VVSHGAGKNLRSLGYRGDYIVMENGVDFKKDRVSDNELAKLSHEWSLSDGIPVFLFVGRIMWYKGLRLILDGLATLKAAGKPFKMVFIGDGQDYDEVVDYADTLGLSADCVFTGAIRDRELLKCWYCRANLFLFPSNFDTNGLVVREAAAFGLPSLILRGSCASEGVIDGQNGILIDDTVVSMSEALFQFINCPDKLVQIGAAAQAELYTSWEDAVARAVSRYESIIERWKSGAMKRDRVPFDELFAFSGDVALAFEKARAQRHSHGTIYQKREKTRIS